MVMTALRQHIYECYIVLVVKIRMQSAISSGANAAACLDIGRPRSEILRVHILAAPTRKESQSQPPAGTDHEKTKPTKHRSQLNYRNWGVYV